MLLINQIIENDHQQKQFLRLCLYYTGWLLQVLAEKPICSRIRTMASAQYYFCNRAKLCRADLKSKVSHTG